MMLFNFKLNLKFNFSSLQVCWDIMLLGTLKSKKKKINCHYLVNCKNHLVAMKVSKRLHLLAVRSETQKLLIEVQNDGSLL